jgi:hypothetical protein
MSSLIFSFLASGCAALSNLFFRKNARGSTDVDSSTGYAVLFYFFSWMASLIFYPEIWKVNINVVTLAIGCCEGFLNVILMLVMSKALNQGPAGLTFAFQNASAVFPGILLFVCFGPKFGFACSSLQLIGLTLVLIGLFLGAKNESTKDSKASFKWLKYALACFVIQALALTLIQGRCILFDCSRTELIPLSFRVKAAEDAWFMPAQFGTAFLLQALIFFREKRKLHITEMTYGVLGGLTNFGSTRLLLLATTLALPFEKGILFPCFAVSTIILCNIWANRLYNEDFNIKANSLCALGTFVGMLR